MLLHRLNRLAMGLALAGCAHVVHAAGFALIEQNASGLGNAYAGQAASAQDASTIFFNPAGMTLLPGRQLVVAGHLIKPSSEFSGTVSAPFPVGGGEGGDAGDWALVPNAYFSYQLTPEVFLGVGLNSPFGLKTEYDDDWMGRFQAVKSELTTINLNPSIAYKASDTLSIGAGLNIQWIEADLTNNVPIIPPGIFPLVKINGDDYGWGYNLGLLWQPSPTTRVGFAYRSEIDFELEGSSSTSGPSVALLNGPVTAEVTLPDSASLSLFHQLSPQWDVLADITWMGWSDFDKLAIEGTVNKTTPENWDDSMRYSLGVNYHLNSEITLRGGIAYDETPVPDTYRTARIPDESRTWLAFGAQYKLTKQGMLDVGYAHLFVKDSSLYSTDNGTLLDGSYENSVDIISAQYAHSF